ncbi:unnamed protein product [Dimorphilus gyrociliatus]|uniref:Uncharacterized protein n=1 Tax=Dimorphilus gyrociliatus TaxID=2664684 RepID=A0A7I8VET4_9ANNE|nr:unnamed protein product [Dimorphilus gyrociliatus]
MTSGSYIHSYSTRTVTNGGVYHGYRYSRFRSEDFADNKIDGYDFIKKKYADRFDEYKPRLSRSEDRSRPTYTGTAATRKIEENPSYSRAKSFWTSKDALSLSLSRTNSVSSYKSTTNSTSLDAYRPSSSRYQTATTAIPSIRPSNETKKEQTQSNSPVLKQSPFSAFKRHPFRRGNTIDNSEVSEESKKDAKDTDKHEKAKDKKKREKEEKVGKDGKKSIDRHESRESLASVTSTCSEKSKPKSKLFSLRRFRSVDNVNKSDKSEKTEKKDSGGESASANSRKLNFQLIESKIDEEGNDVKTIAVTPNEKKISTPKSLRKLFRYGVRRSRSVDVHSSIEEEPGDAIKHQSLELPDPNKRVLRLFWPGRKKTTLIDDDASSVVSDTASIASDLSNAPISSILKKSKRDGSVEGQRKQTQFSDTVQVVQQDKHGNILTKRSEKLKDDTLKNLLEDHVPGERVAVQRPLTLGGRQGATSLIIPLRIDDDMFDAQKLVIKKESNTKTLSLVLRMGEEFLEERISVRSLCGGQKLAVTAYKYEPLGDGSKYLRRFCQRYALPYSVDPYEVRAAFGEHGQLTIEAPLREV